jgi:amino acid permease
MISEALFQQMTEHPVRAMVGLPLVALCIVLVVFVGNILLKKIEKMFSRSP